MHSSRIRTVRCRSRLPRGCLPRGVSAWGCLPRGGGGVCLPRGGVCPGGVCPEGGICPGGCLPRVVYPSMHWGRHTPCGQNSWHTLVKILSCRDFVADGNYRLPTKLREGKCFHGGPMWLLSMMHWTWPYRDPLSLYRAPLLVKSCGQDWRPVQTCSLEDPRGADT